MNVLTAECRGGCGAEIRYGIDDTAKEHAPEVFVMNASVSYAGGHLCDGCRDAVTAVLLKRREDARAKESR